MKELPIIYLVHDLVSPPSTEISSAEMAAWLNGWCPVRPPGYSPPGPDGSSKLASFYGGRARVGEVLLSAIDTLFSVSDAILIVGDKLTDTMSVQLDRYRTNRLPTYAMDTGVRFPQPMKLAPPPFHLWPDAAKWVSIEGWACKTCSRLYGVGDHAERTARWCCSKEVPCNGCGVMTDKSYTLCSSCRGKADIACHAKRKRAPWNNLMLWSDAGDRWYDDLDSAIDAAVYSLRDEHPGEPTPSEIKERLDDMRLLLAEPNLARPFEFMDHVRDDLPTEDDDYPDLSGCDAAVEALNKAIEGLGPLSYNHTNVALDVESVKCMETSRRRT